MFNYDTASTWEESLARVKNEREGGGRGREKRGHEFFDIHAARH